MKSRRQAFALAAALAVTVLTGAAAITGITHGVTHQQAVAPIVQTVQPAPAPPSHEGRD